MGQLKNGVEVIQKSTDDNDYVVLKAVAADVWEQDAFLYFDNTSETVKKFVPADTTETQANQAKIIGIAQSGKKDGDITAVVCLKATVLMDSTAVDVGEEMVVKYNATTARYSAHEGAAYNTAIEPDITLTLDFLTGLVTANESDGRAKLLVDGRARFNALN